MRNRRGIGRVGLETSRAAEYIIRRDAESGGRGRQSRCSLSVAMSACGGSLLRPVRVRRADLPDRERCARPSSSTRRSPRSSRCAASSSIRPQPRASIRKTSGGCSRRSGCHVVRVGQPWRREGRRFVQVRMETDDVRTLGQCGVLAWSAYVFEHDEAGIHFQQKIGAAAAGNPGQVNWDGSELVAFKLHLPSRIVWHNVRKLKDDSAGDVERGNILTLGTDAHRSPRRQADRHGRQDGDASRSSTAPSGSSAARSSPPSSCSPRSSGSR